MKNLWILSATAVSLITASPTSANFESLFHTSADSVEAELSFQAQVEIASPTEPTEAAALDKVHHQIKFLIGPLRQGKSELVAVPWTDYKVSLESVQRKSGMEETFLANYRYTGKLLVQAKGRDRARDSITVFLPHRPETVYGASLVGGKSRCEEFPEFGEDEFWYYWIPTQEDCPLVEGRHFTRLKAKLKFLTPSSAPSYPEYARLVTQAGEISIHALFGRNKEDASLNPEDSDDGGARSYKGLRSKLRDAGFKGRRWTREETERVLGFSTPALPHIEEFTKKLARATVVVRMFYGDTSLDGDSEMFHHFFKDAIENASVMIYAGHSGLGTNLNADLIEKREGFRILAPTDRYQIYYLNGCVTYTYYGSSYFHRKATAADPNGTKNLEVIINGLSGKFGSWSIRHNWIVLDSVLDWARGDGRGRSYREITAKAEDGYFFGVVGDEDNPR